jgi:hypothetical protein
MSMIHDEDVDGRRELQDIQFKGKQLTTCEELLAGERRMHEDTRATLEAAVSGARRLKVAATRHEEEAAAARGDLEKTREMLAAAQDGMAEVRRLRGW